MYCWLVGKAEAGGTPGGGDAPGGPGVLKAEAGGTPGGGFKGVCAGVDMMRAQAINCGSDSDSAMRLLNQSMRSLMIG